VADWSFAHFFQRDFDIKGEGIQHYSFPNIVFGTMHYFHPCFLLPAVVLLFFVQKRDFEGNVLFYWVLPAGIYAIFLMGYPHQNTRHQTLILPFIAYILYPAFTRIWAKGEGRGLAGAMVLLVQIGLIYLAIRPLYIYQQHEKGIASLIKQTSPPVQAVYTLGMEGALSAYMDVPVVSLFHTEIDSVVYPFCLVVPDNFMEVWKGRLPLQNFTRIEAMADWDTMPLPTPKWRAWTSQKKKADLYLREKLQ
jgi:hypothetical protein